MREGKSGIEVKIIKISRSSFLSGWIFGARAIMMTEHWQLYFRNQA